MEITCKDNTYKVYFTHKDQRATVCLLSPRTLQAIELHNVATYACLGLPPDTLPCGVARRAAKDQFCKRTGRKLAFGRALRALTPDRQLRRELWGQYFAQANHPEVRRAA